MKYFILLFSLLILEQTNAQTDSTFIRTIYDTALSNGESYNDLRSLCKDIGARVTGSAEAEMAVFWGEQKMKEYNFDRVYLQEIEVPHWERGTTEAGWIKDKYNSLTKVHLLALGGSIGTDGMMEGEIIEFSSLDELKGAKKKDVEGKIVFINQKMNPNHIATFKAYGGCYPIRGNGAIEASRLGAIAVIIRSLGLPISEHPHTGSMHYNDSIKKIPAAAISTLDAENLSLWLLKEKANFVLEMDCREYPPTKSYNVIGEITGSENPNNIITFGGHLDSWDTGEGAHDDGAGIVHCLEAMRILKTINYQPKNTLRLVFFMNEENGNMGGKTYATWAKDNGDNIIAAIESDRGGFAPRGFQCDGTAEQVALLQSFEVFLSPYDLHVFEKGYGGVDISPLKNNFEGIPLFGLVPDSQRYFDVHHSPNDVFETVNKRELELGCAAVASILYLLDNSL